MCSIFNNDLPKLGLRERFSRVMHFKEVNRIPFFEFGYWDEKLPVWHSQGLPKEINSEAKAYEYLGKKKRQMFNAGHKELQYKE